MWQINDIFKDSGSFVLPSPSALAGSFLSHGDKWLQNLQCNVYSRHVEYGMAYTLFLATPLSFPGEGITIPFPGIISVFIGQDCRANRLEYFYLGTLNGIRVLLVRRKGGYILCAPSRYGYRRPLLPLSSHQCDKFVSFIAFSICFGFIPYFTRQKVTDFYYFLCWTEIISDF